MERAILAAALLAVFNHIPVADAANKVRMYASTTVVLAQNPPLTVYIPVPGSTLAVKPPVATPTLIYNCAYMPLICENVASWSRNKYGSVNLPGVREFVYDGENRKATVSKPNQQARTNRRRDEACGCFLHDSCAPSNGRYPGPIANIVAGLNLPPISAADSAVLAANKPNGKHPGAPIGTVPARFVAQGLAFTCDEFPPATWIQGGSGAETICALQSWDTYCVRPGNPVQTMWRTPGAGVRAEQNFQADSHKALKEELVKQGCDKLGVPRGVVAPFKFTTTTLAVAATKAWVEVAGNPVRVISKRDFEAQQAQPTAVIDSRSETHDDKAERPAAKAYARRSYRPSRLFRPRDTCGVPDEEPGDIDGSEDIEEDGTIDGTEAPPKTGMYVQVTVNGTPDGDGAVCCLPNDSCVIFTSAGAIAIGALDAALQGSWTFGGILLPGAVYSVEGQGACSV